MRLPASVSGIVPRPAARPELRRPGPTAFYRSLDNASIRNPVSAGLARFIPDPHGQRIQRVTIGNDGILVRCC